MPAIYKSPNVIPGSHADTAGCRYCPQYICRHCTGLKKCNDTWEAWKDKPDIILGSTKYTQVLPRE